MVAHSSFLGSSHKCGKVSHNVLKKHIMTVHEGIKPFKCDLCNKHYYTPRDVKVHIQIAHEVSPFLMEV